MTPESAGALLIGCSPSRRHSPSLNSRWADCYAENNMDKHHYPHFFSPTPPHLNMWFIKSMTCHCWGNSLREGTTVSRRLSSPWGPWRVARQSWGRHTEEKQDCLSLWSLCRKQRELILIIHDATGCFSHTHATRLKDVEASTPRAVNSLCGRDAVLFFTMVTAYLSWSF